MGRLADRFWARVDRSAGADGCWLWQGARNAHGYGVVRVPGKKNWLTHRLAWVLSGYVLADLHLLHRCDNPACCNPKHCFLGTQADNNRDRDQKGRLVVRAKLSDADRATILAALAQGTTQRALAKQYGVDPSTISDIHTNRRSERPSRRSGRRVASYTRRVGS